MKHFPLIVILLYISIQIICTSAMRVLATTNSITIQSIQIVYNCTDEGDYEVEELQLGLKQELKGKYTVNVQEISTTLVPIIDIDCESDGFLMKCKTADLDLDIDYAVLGIKSQETIVKKPSTIHLYDNGLIELDRIQTTPQLVDYGESMQNHFNVQFTKSVLNTKIPIFAMKDKRLIDISDICQAQYNSIEDNYNTLSCYPNKTLMGKGTWMISLKDNCIKKDNMITLRVFDPDVYYETGTNQDNASNTITITPISISILLLCLIL